MESTPLPPVKNFLLLLMAVTAFAQMRAAGYWEEYQAKLKKDGPGPVMEKFINEGAATHANDPDYYAASANYWCRAASSVLISTKPAGKGDLVLTDQKTGKPVGSISLEDGSDPEYDQKAVKILEEGNKRFPWRADIALGLASLQFKTGNPKSCTETLLGLLATAQKNPSALRWMGDAPLPGPPQDFIPNSVYDYCAKLYKLNDTKADSCCRQLCEEMVRIYPENPKPLNLLAALANADHKPDEALGWLQKAHAADPKDALVLMNLADMSRKLGKNKEAIDAWKEVIALPQADEDSKREAQASINKLQQPPSPSTPSTPRK